MLGKDFIDIQEFYIGGSKLMITRMELQTKLEKTLRNL